MLAQFGNRSFSPAIEWESAMRIIHEASGWVTKSDETSSTTAESVWSMHEPAAPRSRPSAVSRLMTCAIEGLAAYAEATHPYLVDPGDDTGWRTNGSRPAGALEGARLPVGGLGVFQPAITAGSRCVRRAIGSVLALRGSLATFWFGRRNKAPVVRLDALDDRVRRDIGVDRHQFEFWAGQMGPHGW